MEDPERVIAEALRAQAARTPLPVAETTALASAPGPGGGSGLPGAAARPAGATARLEPPPRVPLAAILLLAAVLGLASGAVVGLVTLL